MKKLIRRVATPSNVMAATALFVALGGVSYAAVKLPRNSVGTVQLKANAVTGVKIKNRSIAAPDLAPNAVTGAAISEKSLGTVPSALKADMATAATTATSATTAANATHAEASANLAGFVRVNKHVAAEDLSAQASFTAALNASAPTVLGTLGPFTLEGRCFLYAGNVNAEQTVKSATDLSVMETDNDDLDGGTATDFLSTSTLPSARQVQSTSAGVNSSDLYGSHSIDATFRSASDFSVTSFIASGAKQGTLAAGDGAWGAGNSCTFSGVMFQG